MKKSLNTKEIKKIGLTPQEYCYKLIYEKLLEIAKAKRDKIWSENELI